VLRRRSEKGDEQGGGALTPPLTNGICPKNRVVYLFKKNQAGNQGRSLPHPKDDSVRLLCDHTLYLPLCTQREMCLPASNMSSRSEVAFSKHGSCRAGVRTANRFWCSRRSRQCRRRRRNRAHRRRHPERRSSCQRRRVTHGAPRPILPLRPAISKVRKEGGGGHLFPSGMKKTTICCVMIVGVLQMSAWLRVQGSGLKVRVEG
jgi:hypothetical protein